MRTCLQLRRGFGAALMDRPMGLGRTTSCGLRNCKPCHNVRRRTAILWLGCYRRVCNFASPGDIFSAATVVVLPIYALMMARPHSTLTKRVVTSPTTFVAGALAYAAVVSAWLSKGAGAAIVDVLFQSSPMPNVDLFAALFRLPEVTCITWIHLLVLDLFQARYVFLDGLWRGIPTAHSLVLCFMVGPIGLISHAATRALCRPKPREPPEPPPFSNAIPMAS